MKITITVNCKNYAHNNLILFGARFNYLMANFGNRTTNELIKLEFDENYKQKIGESNYEIDYFNFSAFFMDCIKYDLRVISINGKVLDKELNPYLETYELKINEGLNHVVIELKKI